MEVDFEIRKLQTSDDEPMAKIIRSSLREFKADKPGTVYYDLSTDHLTALFETKGRYFVAVENGILLGGAGIFPTSGLPDDTVELVKMYLVPHARGAGLGKRLINRCIETAVNQGFKYIYLETMPELSRAVQTYEKLGFERLISPLGVSGHHSCEIWMRLTIS